MDRRDLLKLTGAAAGAGLIGTASAAADGTGPEITDHPMASPSLVDRSRRHFAIAHPWSVSSPYGDALLRLAMAVSAASNGRLTLEAHPDMPIATGDHTANFDATLTAAPQLHFAGDDPIAQLFGGLPQWPGPGALEAWLMLGGGQELWDLTSEARGAKPFLLASLGQPKPLWSSRPLRNSEAFHGARIHLSGASAHIANEVFGIVATAGTSAGASDPWADFAAGRLDAIEGDSIVLDVARRRPDDARHPMLGGLTAADTVLALEVPLDAWRGLDDDLRQILQAAISRTSRAIALEAKVQGAIAMRVLAERDGMTPSQLDDDSARRISLTTEDYLSSIATDGHLGRLVVNSLRGFRQVAEGIATGAGSREFFGV